MQLKETEFQSGYRQLEIISNTDSGLLAVQYGPNSETPKPTFEQDLRDWGFRDKGDTYTLRIPKPQQRKVLRTVILSRTSINHYELAYADKLGAVHETAKSMSAVHSILRPLWARELL